MKECETRKGRKGGQQGGEVRGSRDAQLSSCAPARDGPLRDLLIGQLDILGVYSLLENCKSGKICKVETAVKIAVPPSLVSVTSSSLPLLIRWNGFT